MISIDEAKCKHCNLCHVACPDGIIAKGPQIRVEAHQFCIQCGHCFAVCPQNAITLLDFEGIETPPIPQRVPIDSELMMALLATRRSARAYEPQTVSREHLEAILRAASWAPSSMNARPVRAYVYTDQAMIARIRDETARFYSRLLRLLSLPGFPILWRVLGRDPRQLGQLAYGLTYITTSDDKPDPILYDARTLISFTVPKRDKEAAGDAWLAAQNAVLYAETIPVVTCYNGFAIAAANNSRRLRAAMGVPKSEQVVVVLTLGYPKLRFLRQPPRRTMDSVWK